jgi:hypothetical protein
MEVGKTYLMFKCVEIDEPGDYAGNIKGAVGHELGDAETLEIEHLGG